MTGARWALCVVVVYGVLIGIASPNLHASCFKRPFVRGVGELRQLEQTDFLGGVDFEVVGTVTLVDQERGLIVVQDEVGAVALHLAGQNISTIHPGLLLRILGSNSVPYVNGFPQFPHQPVLRARVPSVQLPRDFGEYYLSRFRGFLVPPETGEYIFWICTDNSGELWLSTDETPRGLRRIALIPRYGWADPGEWERYFSQRSAPIKLEAGKRYYFEVFHEQATVASHVSIAWSGPGFSLTEVSSEFLRPADKGENVGGDDVTTVGVDFELWTNFCAGDLTLVAGPLPFRGALSVREAKIEKLGGSAWPTPYRLSPGQQLPLQENYRWVEIKGRVQFQGSSGETGFLEIWDGQENWEVYVQGGLPPITNNSLVLIRGVWEVLIGERGDPESIILHVPLLEMISTDAELEMEDQGPSVGIKQEIIANFTNNLTRVGYYAAHGVVTFNAEVLGKHYFFVQEEKTPILVYTKRADLTLGFRVGQFVEVFGEGYAGGSVPMVDPLVIKLYGAGALPKPIKNPLLLPNRGLVEGRWVELEGIVQSLGPSGELRLMTMGGNVLVLGALPPPNTERLVDAFVCVRGVLTWEITNGPVLLLPSPVFLNVVEEAPIDPWTQPVQTVAAVAADTRPEWQRHRVRIQGTVTHIHNETIFLQDQTGGVGITANEAKRLEVGDVLDVLGFPTAVGPAIELISPIYRKFGSGEEPTPERFLPGKMGKPYLIGKLIQVEGRVLDHRGNKPLLAMQTLEGPIVFCKLPGEATNANGKFKVGSKVRVTGIYWPSFVGFKSGGDEIGGLRGDLQSIIIVRKPEDMILLAGPPWLTGTRVAILICMLSVVIGVSLLVIRFLHLRLDRQRALQLALSKQFFQGQELERKRIAVNLHDGLGQNLIVIKNQLRLIAEAIPSTHEDKQKLVALEGIVTQAIDEVRRIINDLRPWHLDQLGITRAIKSMLEFAASTSRIDFAAHVEDIDSLFTKDAEIHIYRIVQEGINNILKHSQATEAVVVIMIQDDHLRISIRDNGKGFIVPNVEESMIKGIGHGLGTIAERVRILGGQWKIESAPGAGTRLSIEIPLNKNQSRYGGEIENIDRR